MATMQQQSMAWRLCQTGELEEPGISGVHMHSEGSAGILLKGFLKRIVSGHQWDFINFHKQRQPLNDVMFSCFSLSYQHMAWWSKKEKASKRVDREPGRWRQFGDGGWRHHL